MWFFLLCQQRARVFTLISKNGVQNITEDRGWECAGEFWHADNICCWSRTSHDQKDGWWGPTCPHFLNPQQPLFFWALGESGNKLWTQQWRNHLHYWRHPAVTEQHCHLNRLKHVSVTDKAFFHYRAQVSSVWHYAKSVTVNHYWDWSLFIQGCEKLSVNSSLTLVNNNTDPS